MKNKFEKKETTTKTWLYKYQHRKDDFHLSFHEYVFKYLNDPTGKKRNNDKLCIPHYSGVLQYCRIRLSEYYCEHALLIYKPWTKSNPITASNNESYVKQFKKF